MKSYPIAIAWFLVLSTQLWASHANYGDHLPLYYDPGTGNVTIDTTNISGGEFVSYSLSRVSVPEAGDFLFANHTPFMPNLFSPISTFRAVQETSWPNDPLTPGVYSLGNILPTGLTREELFTSYFGETGRLSKPGDRSDFTYVAKGSFDLDTPLTHIFDINYSPSPYPPLNDPDQQPEVIQWAIEASLSYDPSDGSVYLNSTGPNGGTIWGYKIEVQDNMGREDQFTPVNDGEFSAVSEDTFVENNRIPEGIHNLGAILPLGLDDAGLMQTIDRASFIGEPGHGRDALDVSVNGVPFALTIVPEPAASWLTLLSLTFLFRISSGHKPHLRTP